MVGRTGLGPTKHPPVGGAITLIEYAAFSCDPPITNFSCPITLPLCVPWRPLRLCGKFLLKDSALRGRIALPVFWRPRIKRGQISRTRPQHLPQRFLRNFCVTPVGDLRDEDIGLAVFGHQLRIPLGGLFREIGKTLFGSLEFVRNHKSKSTQPVQSVQPPPTTPQTRPSGATGSVRGSAGNGHHR